MTQQKPLTTKPILVEADKYDHAQELIDQALTYVGIKETGVNAGFDNPVFEDLMRQANWLPGEPWCASFCRMIWLSVYEHTEWYAELDKVLSKSVIRTWRNAKESGIIKVSQEPVPGGIILWSTGRGFGHQGIVRNLVDEFTLYSIEGNTNKRGSRTGDSVMVKRRKTHPSTKWNKNWNYLGTILPPPYANVTA